MEVSDRGIITKGRAGSSPALAGGPSPGGPPSRGPSGLEGIEAAAPVAILVERFDIEPFSDFSAKINEQNLEGSFSSVSTPNLQENIRWKAIAEIYKIYMLLHRSDLNISDNFRQTFSHFSAKFANIRYF